MIDNIKNYLFRLQEWYLNECNGVWEKRFKIKIDTIDNPGWSLLVDLNGTQLEKEKFKKVRIDITEDNWVHCWIEEEQFQGAGGPENLIDIIKIFISWNDKLCLAKNAFSTRSENVLHWLQKWYKSQCDGDWETNLVLKLIHLIILVGL